MKRWMTPFALILFACSIGYGGEHTAASGRINVEINGLRNDLGEVRVHLYNSREGFPSNPDKAFMTLVVGIGNGQARVVFDGVPFGEYAISSLHDENGNKKMDLNWLIIPKEGVGASNNPKMTFGPPSFNDAKFRLSAEEITIKIKTKY